MIINILDQRDFLDLNGSTTKLIQNAINECSKNGGGTVIIPGNGDYIIDGIVMENNVTLSIEKGARLIGSGNESKYIKREGPFELLKNDTPICSLIYAKNSSHISIVGAGKIIGSYQKFIFPEQKLAPHLKSYKYPRPMTIYFENCKNIYINNVTISDAPFWTIHLVGCVNTEIDDIKIYNESRMPNTDGIDIDRSKNTFIHNCIIVTGDDAICSKCTEETKQYGDCTNLLVENCQLTSQSSGIKFGSSSFGNFVNCNFKKISIKDSNRGLAFQLRDPGSAKNIIFEDINIVTKHFTEEWWGSGEPIL
ncbi:glycoside hydrolase family 28 protein [Paucilactobacillus hokkaidonensis]|uniref:glycoside hydrolase family 28 protein n=1 Tax=Paucilactobacillus hokkaidonensis TaxID=1193095 RepID=UPI0006D0767C|nr:glycosyl hydrolase family 28 protein [Paucilactobacillus hokkaidonensis]